MHIRKSTLLDAQDTCKYVLRDSSPYLGYSKSSATSLCSLHSKHMPLSSVVKLQNAYRKTDNNFIEAYLFDK